MVSGRVVFGVFLGGFFGGLISIYAGRETGCHFDVDKVYAKQLFCNKRY